MKAVLTLVLMATIFLTGVSVAAHAYAAYDINQKHIAKCEAGHKSYCTIITK